MKHVHFLLVDRKGLVVLSHDVTDDDDDGCVEAVRESADLLATFFSLGYLSTVIGILQPPPPQRKKRPQNGHRRVCRRHTQKESCELE